MDRRLNNLASAIGDLVARSKIVTDADVDTIFDIAPGAMYPFCKSAPLCTSAGLGMRMTAVNMSSTGSGNGGLEPRAGKDPPTRPART